MKRKHVSPESKLVQLIRERLRRLVWRNEVLNKNDDGSGALDTEIHVVEVQISELRGLLDCLALYEKEAKNHGDCIPVTENTVMDLG